MPPTTNEMLVRKIFLFLVITIILQSCMFSHSHGYHAYFCTTTPSDEKRYLFIDEKEIGVLPYTKDVPECEEMPSHKHAVYTKLSAGEHLVEIKTADGFVLFTEELEVERRKGSSSISSIVEKPGWDTRVKVKDDQIVIELIH
jgi:hypothetical protein